MAKFSYALNRRTHGKLKNQTALFYPSSSFSRYLNKPFPTLDIRQIKQYRDPVTNRVRKIGIRKLQASCAARSFRFFTAFTQVYTNRMSLAESRKILRAYSLNNGHVGVPTREMKHFKPLPIINNFEVSPRELPNEFVTQN